MVRNSSSACLACFLLAEKSVYIRIFGKQQNVMLWSRGSYFVLFLQNLNFEVFTLSNMWLVLGKNNENCSGLFFYLFFSYTFDSVVVSVGCDILCTHLGQMSGRLSRGYLWENSPIFLCSIFVSPLEFHAHLTVTCCCMQVLSDY